VTIDLEQHHRNHICAILGQHLGSQRGVRFYVYGSRSRGNAHKFSDVDLAIESEQPLDDNLIPLLRNAFAESNLPYVVDITDLAHTTPIFRANVNHHRELLFET
jgi:predicted nucleotidyltransferase